ncbi:MAG: S8 family serine peptidase [Verrucomicrobiota bacterium]
MKKLWLTAPILLALLAFFFGRHLSQQRHSANETLAHPSSPSHHKQTPDAPLSPQASPFPSITDKDISAALDALSKGALANERILRFNSIEDLNAFLADAAKQGLEVISVDPHLLSLRIRTENRQDLTALQRLAKDRASIERNYLVSQPQPPLSRDPSATDQFLPFYSHAKAWLGAPDDTSEWGKGVTIAVLDTGIDSSSATSIDVLKSSDTDHSHGTSVASVFARDDDLALVPQADILSIRVLDSNGNGDTYTLAQGIVEAADRGADIINLSLGTYGDNSLVRDAITYAESQGAVIVAASGNDGYQNITFPAALDSVIGVGAVDANNQLTDFSNTGEGLDIVAPGYGVESSLEQNDTQKYSSGTSIATPFVSATIAAVLSQEPDLTPTEAAQIVLDNSNDIGAPGQDLATGSGSLDIDRILNRDTPNLSDVAVSDFHLDFENATEHMIPLQITVENRGTEKLHQVYLEFSQEDGQAQSVYLGDIQESDTTAHTLYIDRYKFETENGFSIEATATARSTDSRPYNNQKAATLRLTPEG